jgi:hypothetical protein
MSNGIRKGARIGKIVIVPRPRLARLTDVRPPYSWRSKLLAAWGSGLEEQSLCAAPLQRLDTEPPAVVQFVSDSR